jgi:hypothetical protein
MYAVIGAFDNQAQAQDAANALVQAGFDRGAVHLEHEAHAAVGTQAQAQPGTGRHTGILGFLQSLFTTEDQANTGHAHTYEEALRRGSTVLMVNARDDAEATRACTLLHEAGAVDVDERARQWRSEAGDSNVQGAAPARHPLDRAGVRVFPRT